MVEVGEFIYIWRIYHPDNWQPIKVYGRDYTEPLVINEHKFLIEAENTNGTFDGYLIATLTPEIPFLTEYWNSRGWKIESKGIAEKMLE